MELCWFVHYFVKIPKSGEAEEKRTRLLNVFVCSHKHGGFLIRLFPSHLFTMSDAFQPVLLKPLSGAAPVCELEFPPAF